MSRPFRSWTERGFLLGGILIILMTWGANLLATLEAPADVSGHSAASDLYLWLMLMFNGLAFATVGIAYENYQRLLTDGVFATRYVIGFLFIADGALHLLAFNEHLSDSFWAAGFFAAFAPIQIVVGVEMPYLGRRFYPVWTGLTAFFIAAYALTRTMAVWPIGVVEAVDPLGILSKLVEVLTIIFLIGLARADRPEPLPLQRPAASGEP
jgi:hypothetical protein